MSAPSVISRNYADLDAVRRVLDHQAGDDGPDGLDLERLALGVTAEIEAGLGVVWDGTDAADKATVRRFHTINRRVVLYPPLLRLDAVNHLKGAVTDVLEGVRDPVRGWARSLTVGLPVAGIGPDLVTVEGRWMDDPGGDPPAAVATFASWATAQEWRRQFTGSSGTVYPEGYKVTVDNAWKTGGRWERLVDLCGLPPYRARVR